MLVIRRYQQRLNQIRNITQSRRRQGSNHPAENEKNIQVLEENDMALPLPYRGALLRMLIKSPIGGKFYQTK